MNEASSDRFDPSKFLTTLKGKSYLEVKWRMLWLRTEHPDAVIETELIEHDREKKWCMFKARVSIPNGGSATGYGQEDAAGFVGNPGDYPEKAETKALGRALASLGYGTQFTEDFDFDADARDGSRQQAPPRRVVGSPIERAKANPRVQDLVDAGGTVDNVTPLLVTPKALDAIRDLAKQKGMTDAELVTLAHQHADKETLTQLTRAEAKAVWEAIKERSDAASG